MTPTVPDAAVARRTADVPASGPAATRPFAGPPLGTRERRDRGMGWRSRDVARATIIVLAIYVAAQLFWFANSLVFVVFLGVLFGLAVASAVDRLERFKIRRGVASALIVFGTLGALIGVGTLIAPALTSQFSVLRQQIPTAVNRAEAWVNAHPTNIFATAARSVLGPTAAAGGAGERPATSGGAAPAAGQPAAPPQPNATTGATPAPQQSGTPAAAPAAGAPSATASLQSKIGGQLSKVSGYLFGFLSSVGTVAAGLVLIVFLAIYVGAEPTLYHDGLMHLFPHRARKKAGEVLSEMATVLRKWLVTQLIAMVVIGGVTALAMFAFKVKAALALGFIAGVFEFIPTVGPIFSAVPAVAMGFVDGPDKALGVVAIYWGIQFLENNLLIPYLMRGGMDLPPALTLVAQALLTLVFGFLGLMVAVPLTAAALVPIKLLWVRDTIGDDIEVRDEDDDEEGDDGDKRPDDQRGPAGTGGEKPRKG